MQSIVSHQVFILPWSRMSQQSHWRHADICRTQNGRIKGPAFLEFQLVLSAADCFSMFEGRSCHFARSHWGKKRPLLNASICQMRVCSLAVVVLGFSGTSFGPQSVSADETPGGCSKHSSLIWKLLPQWQKMEQTPALTPAQYRKLDINRKKEERIKLMWTINWRPELAEGWRSWLASRRLALSHSFGSSFPPGENCRLCHFYGISLEW